MSNIQNLKMNDETTYYVCQLCPDKKTKYSAMKHVASHLNACHSGFGFQCSRCKKLFKRKDGHKSCGATMQRVKKTNGQFGEEEKMELNIFQKNIRSHVKTINGQVDIDQGKEKENNMRFSKDRKRKLDKPRKPFENVIDSSSVNGERANMEYPKIHEADFIKRYKTSSVTDADVIYLCAPSDDSLYDEDDKQTLENIEENVDEIIEPEPEVVEVSEINTSTQEDPIAHNSNIVEKLKKIQECQESPVHLIVGGDKFVSTIQTIEAEPSLLSAMVAKDSIVKPQLIDNIPTYSLDSNPAEFSIILDYLRKKANGTVGYELPDRTSKNLLMEARYYELEGLNSLIVNKL